ncbi:MAG: nucleotidyltransferase domain-containing protein [Patescibacteria group bacterium]
MRKVSKKIKTLGDTIARGYRPEQVILFGSHAWGSPRPDSDIDFFVIKKTRHNRLERAQKAQSLLWGAGVPVDTLIYTPAEVKRRLDKGDFFIEQIIKKGVVLYKRPA